MNTNNEGGLDLSPEETTALALRIISQQISKHDDWLQWENYPLLSEGAFGDLDRRIKEFAHEARSRSASFDHHKDIDSAEILEATQ